MYLGLSRGIKLEEHNEDDEGFLREEKIDMRLIDTVKNLQEVTIELPEAKELINFGRPTQLRPRCLAQDEITELPSNVSYQEKQKDESKSQAYIKMRTSLHKSSCIDPIANRETNMVSSVTSTNPKRVYNGRGKTLYDFFEADDSFQLIFRKGVQDRPRQQIIYDYTAKTKVLEFTNDYDPKLYRLLKSHKELQLNSTVDLQFDSRFQCGNLSKVFQERASPNSFYCLLENDSNTHGYSQWFCFRVRNITAGQYTFHIVNHIKNTSMYKQGMRVSIFSEVQNKVSQRGWYKGGDDISYSNTRIERTNKENQSYYCLAFTHTFENQKDTVYFALNQPYTYTRLLKFIESVEPVFKSNQIAFTKKTIGYTIANNNIVSLVIQEQISQPKKVIVIMARQHPGETVGSFIAEGLVEALLQESPEVCFLIKHFRLVVIPMVNPDGVIYGHSRCNLAGLDLNRQWGSELMKQLTPETYAVKKYIQNLHERYGVEAMIDLHGHSKKMNSFFYACKKQNKYAMRLLSFAMSKLNENFDASSCTYGLSKDKVNTVRSINAYTLENSYFGRERNGLKEHYTQADLKTIGSSLLKSLFVLYADRDTVRSYSLNRQSLLEQIETNIDKIQAQQSRNKNDSGSESDPDGDLLALQERMKIMRIRDPTKKSKLMKSFRGTLKKKRYMSSVQCNKLAKQEAEEIQKQKKKRLRQEKSELKQPLLTQPAKPQLSKRRKSYTRTNAVLKKRFERPSRTQTQSFNLSVNKDQKQIKQQKISTKELLLKNSIPSQQLFEHPSRTKGLMIKGPIRLTKTEQSASIEKFQKQISVKKIETHSRRQTDKFIMELDATRLRLTKEQLKLCDILNKEKCLDQTEFIKIESVYRNKKQQQVHSPPPQQSTLSRKISRSKKRFKVSPLDPTPIPKFRKFESFLSETETHAQAVAKHRAFSGLGDQNSVFYHFPLL